MSSLIKTKYLVEYFGILQLIKNEHKIFCFFNGHRQFSMVVQRKDNLPRRGGQDYGKNIWRNTACSKKISSVLMLPQASAIFHESASV